MNSRSQGEERDSRRTSWSLTMLPVRISGPFYSDGMQNDVSSSSAGQDESRDERCQER